MGSEVYEKFANGESFDESLNDKCAQIKAVQGNINTLKERVKNLKGQNNSSISDNTTEDK